MLLTSTNTVSGILPGQWGPLLVEPVQQAAVALNPLVATMYATGSHQFHIPIVATDAGASWVVEGAEITPSDAVFNEVVVVPSKVAGLTIVSSELANDSNPAAAQIVGQGLARSIAGQLDAADAAARAAVLACTGRAGVADVAVGEHDHRRCHPDQPGRLRHRDRPATITSFVCHPSDAGTLSKIKTGTGYATRCARSCVSVWRSRTRPRSSRSSSPRAESPRYWAPFVRRGARIGSSGPAASWNCWRGCVRRRRVRAVTVVIAPQMLAAQENAWLALLEIFARLPAGRCLVGGQLVHLHCWERGYAPNRPTNDADAALDVRARPEILLEFTGFDRDRFRHGRVDMSGHQHRWIRGETWIDILIAEGLGQRGSRRGGGTGATTLASPGMQQALDRTEIVDIEIAGVRGRIPRPSLHAALVVKGAAYGVTADPFRNRHIPDLAVLAAMMRRADGLAAQLTPRDRDHLQVGLAGLKTHRGLWVGIDGAERGVDVLERLLNRS